MQGKYKSAKKFSKQADGLIEKLEESIHDDEDDEHEAEDHEDKSDKDEWDVDDSGKDDSEEHGRKGTEIVPYKEHTED